MFEDEIKEKQLDQSESNNQLNTSNQTFVPRYNLQSDGNLVSRRLLIQKKGQNTPIKNAIGRAGKNVLT